MDKEDIIGIDALYESMKKCSRGVKWKGTVAYCRHHWPDEIAKLSAELQSGTYRERKAKFFTVTEPKRREIMSIHFRDRIYQRSLNDVAIFPQTSRSYIPDNFACQPGKGTMAARERLKGFLHAHYRKHGTEGYVLKIDIKGYYPNMRHDFAENMLGSYLDADTLEMAAGVLSRLPGDTGYNPGSQIVQIVGITALDKIDHYAKERLRVKHYIRYMDDFILIHPDKGYLEQCLADIKEKLRAQGMEVHPKKTSIRSIKEPILFLGFTFRITASGKVVILADPKKIKHERIKLRRMAALAAKGKLTKHDVDVHFKAYKASVRYGNSHNLIYRLNRYYESLWEGEDDGHHQETEDGYRDGEGRGEHHRGGGEAESDPRVHRGLRPSGDPGRRNGGAGMSKIYYEIAKKNYPEKWNRAMVDNIHGLGRLTDEEYADVIGADLIPEIDEDNGV